MIREFWFWQNIVSPHMAPLANALAEQGHHVVYIAEQSMSQNRAKQGWSPTKLFNVHLILCSNKGDMKHLARRSHASVIHICQSIRANGEIAEVQRILVSNKQRLWINIESVNDSGLLGIIKRIVYGVLFRRYRNNIEIVLAIGANTPKWIASRGVPLDSIYPFAYFLPEKTSDSVDATLRKNDTGFRLIYVGQLIERKRVDLLLDALALIKEHSFDLTIVGSGPLEEELRNKADRIAGLRMRWIGTLPIDDVHKELTMSDCLVLPSQYDGWGAVVSEALINGLPAICSNGCGVAEIVRLSGRGGVFRAGNVDDLARVMRQVVSRGRISLCDAERLAIWGKSLTAESGAVYIESIANYLDGSSLRPQPPWLLDHPSAPNVSR